MNHLTCCLWYFQVSELGNVLVCVPRQSGQLLSCATYQSLNKECHQVCKTDMGAHHLWIPYMPTDGHNPGPHKRKGSEPPPTAPAAKKPSAKKVGKDTKGKMLASSASSSSSPQSTTPPNLLPVSFVALYQGGISDEVGVNALLDTGNLAGDFVSRRVVDRHSLKPVISDTIYTVCSGLDNNVALLS